MLVGDLLDRVFDGSSGKLLMRALAAKKASRKDLEEIRRMLDEYEGGR
jgi:predicted transcriptional regulator